MSIMRGADKGSTAKWGLRADHPVSPKELTSGRARLAIIKLNISVEFQSQVLDDSQTEGISIRVGRMIFSIVGGLSFGGDLIRGCESWLLVRPVLYLLHMLRMLVEE